MMKRAQMYLIPLLAAILVALGASQALAVPSFARQFGKPCSACHTMWPALNATGRAFKDTAYTTVADDYPRIDKDNLDLLRYSPLSLSVISFPYTRSNSDTAATDIPAEVALFYAGRITPNIGAFIEPILFPEFEFEFAKLASYTRLGTNTIGLAGGKMDAGGVDPYNTFRFTAYHTINSPAIFSQERGAGDFFYFGATDNTGLIAYGRFLNNRLYAATGGFRGHSSDDPWDLYGRVAFDQPVTAESSLSFGGILYSGAERYETAPLSGTFYKSDVIRYGADLSFQMESGANIIEAIAVYMEGEDKDLDNTAGNNVKFKSYYLEVTYVFDRMYGVTLGYDSMKSDEDSSLDKEGALVNVSYNPWLNTKIALEFSDFKIDGDDHDQHVDLLLHLYL
ncbi:MAG: hypothetical protein KJ950_05985 [Proteobacteria bacterium]|nr:hypothetical protein [Pseudomonadota bacterium]MBU1688734.1 hypothetical protein [Pseudomonadota bacterium]